MATLPPLTPLTIGQLTESMAGNGAFDVLMRSVSEHIEAQNKKTRITGNDYATVYLGGMQAVLTTALDFLLRSRKEILEAQLLEQQIILAGVEVQKAQAQLLQIEAQVRLADAEVAKTQAELPLVEAQVRKVEAEIIILEKQGLKIPAEIALLEQQKTNLEDELLTNAAQRDKLVDDLLTSQAQRDRLDQEVLNLVSQKTLVDQQILTEVEQTKVVIAQECKLRAEFDLIEKNILKTAEETALLLQKTATERAQTNDAGVTPGSVVGRQSSLYEAQTKGFKQDAITKTAKELIATWNVRRTTDSATLPNTTNKLDDVTVGQAVQAMLTASQI